MKKEDYATKDVIRKEHEIDKISEVEKDAIEIILIKKMHNDEINKGKITV